MIDPEKIPQFTGDLDALQRYITGLRRDADGIRQAGGAAHTRFQAMSAFYKAPEAEDLFASTMPVRDKADAFAEKVETVANALEDYAQAVGPIAERLKHLKAKARTFIAGLDTDGGAFGTDWTKDQDKVDQHDALWGEIAQARADFYEAEITANNRITALVDGGSQYMADTGGTMFIPQGVTTYGFTADALENAEKLPWGTPEERTHHSWDLGYHGKQLLWDGLVMDGIVGSLKGVAALAGLRGPDEARAAWDGLTRTLVGGSVYATEMGGSKPGGSFWNSDFVQGSKPYAKEFAKGLVAWDQWKENPGRAAGTTIFNFGTLAAGPVKAGTAGRAGAMAKAANTVAKAGEAMDPITAAAKTTSRTLPKVADIAADMRAGAQGGSEAPRGTYTMWELPNGNGVRIEDGKFIRVDSDNNPITDMPRREPAATERVAPDATPDRQPVLVGATAGEGGTGAVGRVGDDLPGGSAAPGGSGDAGRHMPGGGVHDSHTPEARHGSSQQQAGGGSASHEHGAHASGSGPDPTAGTSQNSGAAAGHGGPNDGGGGAQHGIPSGQHSLLDPQAVGDRIKELDDRQGGEGHAPGRHLHPVDQALIDRLGTVKTDANGVPKVYGPSSNYPGLLKSENNIDPLTGTTVDGVSGRPHRVGPYATRFDDAEDMVIADGYFRSRLAQGLPPDEVPIEQILGPKGHERFTGFYRNPANPSEFLPVDFTGGTVFAVYHFRGGSWQLTTMYANPAPGRHP
ncbi:hypothetical protein GCM10010252_04420 [Streptomyces aureoverticillatus]|nr:hypothetical protein GCM10010252_04420 [Streptomyces aureoverticillatus]